MPLTKWGGCCYLSVDPGINATGYAVYQTALGGANKLVQYGAITPPKDMDGEHLKIAYIADSILGLVIEISPNFMYIEQPPFTLYHQKRLGFQALMSRAQDVFKTVAVCFSILSVLRVKTRIKLLTVFPSQWQEHHSKHKGLTSKEWSLREANRLLVDHLMLEPLLTTKLDENIADAIVLGDRAYANQILPS